MSGTAVFSQTVRLLIGTSQEKLDRQRAARIMFGLQLTGRPYMSPKFCCNLPQAWPSKTYRITLKRASGDIACLEIT